MPNVQTYCTFPFVCVKCGGPHDTKICKKDKDLPAKLSLIHIYLTWRTFFWVLATFQEDSIGTNEPLFNIIALLHFMVCLSKSGLGHQQL